MDHFNIDKELIHQNEADNDGYSIHLYWCEEMDSWIAYGTSAYLLRLEIKSRLIEGMRGYSTEFNLPYTTIRTGIFEKIRKYYTVQEITPKEHLEVRVNATFDSNDYKRWIIKLKEELVANGGFNTQTHVSHLVPKDRYIRDGMNVFSRNIKRLVDLLASFVALIVFSPLFLICTILVRREDGGPAIYKQERIGRFGRPFFIYKFRTMRLDAEKMGPQLSHGGGDNDPRLTKIGKTLRAHHLDELPQLWNVFKGDMAFVGPRPERKFYIDQILEHDKRYEYLYQIRPGVTSYATFYNGYTDTMEKMLRRLEYDLYYLGHRSWWFDIKILLKTFFGIVGGKKF